METDIQPPLTVQIRGLIDDLQPAMRRVGEYIVEHPAIVASMTISDLADACDTSETTVVRFCRELGVRGYPQLRLSLATEMGGRSRAEEQFELSGDIAPGDDLASVVEKISFADARSVEDTAKSLSITELAAVVRTVIAARRCDIYGVGASSIVAADLQQKLHRINQIAFAFADPHQALASAALLDGQDVAIAISHSGMTADTIEALDLAHANGAVTVAITNAPRSPLAVNADHVLATAARETTFRSGATGSRLAQLTVVDCLFVGIAQQTYDRSQNALQATYDAVHNRRPPLRTRGRA